MKKVGASVYLDTINIIINPVCTKYKQEKFN